jgi:hypothetical protein
VKFKPVVINGVRFPHYFDSMNALGPALPASSLGVGNFDAPLGHRSTGGAHA